jgi:hypothetical protein
MYFSARIEIDPSQITIIKKLENNSIFEKIMDAFLLGSKSEKIEQETFTVISILNQIQMGLMRLGVDNVIQISINDFVYFYDNISKDHDLSEAMEDIEANIEHVESERFDRIALSLEHGDSLLKYLISIEINRKHEVGEYPIIVWINGLFSKFRLEPSETNEKLRTRMANNFSSQSEYDTLIRRGESHFKEFVTRFQLGLSKFIRVDGINLDFHRKMSRPKLSSKKDIIIHHDKNSEPVFHGYPGVDAYLQYAMLWGELITKNAIFCKNFILTDSSGVDIMEFGEEGIDTKSSGLLNPTVELEIPSDSHPKIYKHKSEYTNDLISLNLLHIEDLEDSSDADEEVTNFSDLDIDYSND